MNDVVKKKNQYLARYEVDPYAAFANESGPGIVGRLLTCKKGDWAIGQDSTPVPPEARFLFVVPETMRGWLKWRDGRVVASDMGLVRDNFLVKHRYALDDLEESEWEKGSDGPRDPWSKSYRALLIECSPPHGDVTLSGSAYGLELALKALCRVYSAEAALHPDAYPVVGLSTHTRPNKSYGPIKGPWFDVHGWATVEDVKAGRKAQAALAKPKKKAKAKPVAAEINDELPDW